jgi:hypothetical protein
LHIKIPPFVAVYKTLVGHVKSDLSRPDESMSLLTPNDVNQFLPCINFPEHKGAYLYYDTNLGAFARSGKVVGPGLSDKEKGQ